MVVTLHEPFPWWGALFRRGRELHKWISFQHLWSSGMSVLYQETTSPSKRLKLVLMFAHKSRGNPWETLAFYKTRDMFKSAQLRVISSLNQMDLVWILALALNLSSVVPSPWLLIWKVWDIHLHWQTKRAWKRRGRISGVERRERGKRRWACPTEKRYLVMQ